MSLFPLAAFKDVFPFSFNFCVLIFLTTLKTIVILCVHRCTAVHVQSEDKLMELGLCPHLQVTWVAGLQNRHRYQLSFLTGPWSFTLMCLVIFCVWGSLFLHLRTYLFFPIRLEKYIPPAYSIPVYTLTRTNKGQQFSHHRIVISCITQG